MIAATVREASTGGWSAVVPYIAGTLGAAAAGGLGTAIWKLIKGMAHDVKAVTSALITEDPTPLNPQPKPGALDVLRQTVATLNSHDETLGVVLVGLKAAIGQGDVARDSGDLDISPTDARKLIVAEERRRAQERQH